MPASSAEVARLGHRFGKEVCDAIAAKCLTGRTRTLDKSLEAFLLWVELEAVEAFMVCEALFSAFSNLDSHTVFVLIHKDKNGFPGEVRVCNGATCTRISLKIKDFHDDTDVRW